MYHFELINLPSLDAVMYPGIQKPMCMFPETWSSVLQAVHIWSPSTMDLARRRTLKFVDLALLPSIHTACFWGLDSSCSHRTSMRPVLQAGVEREVGGTILRLPFDFSMGYHATHLISFWVGRSMSIFSLVSTSS